MSCSRPTPSHPASVRAQLALLFATVLVAACGGGGGDAASATSPAGATAPPPPAAAPASADDPTRTCNLPDFGAAALALVNQKRAAGATCGSTSYGPAAALAWKAQLNQAANGHSADMAAQNYFSHTSKDGRTLSNRVDATGYAWAGLGENIAAGYPSVQAVVNGWMASPGHCVNIMNPDFSEMGLACVPGSSSTTYSNYWTMDLGKPR